MNAFLSVWSQWRVSVGFSGVVYSGLDYVAVKVGLEAEGFTITPDLWRGIRTMEAAARAVLNAS